MVVKISFPSEKFEHNGHFYYTSGRFNLQVKNSRSSTSPMDALSFTFVEYLLVGRAYKALRRKGCYCGWVPIYVTGWLAGYLAIFLCLVVGFRPRFHNGHLTPSGVSCLKRQTTFNNDNTEYSL